MRNASADRSQMAEWAAEATQEIVKLRWASGLGVPSGRVGGRWRGRSLATASPPAPRSSSSLSEIRRDKCWRVALESRSRSGRRP